jgi:hypothetical protein
MRGHEEGSYCATIALMTLVGTSIGVLFVVVREALGIKT